MRQVIYAMIRPNDPDGYLAECAELHAVTEGDNLDQTVANLLEVIELALEGEGLEEQPITLTAVHP